MISIRPFVLEYYKITRLSNFVRCDCSQITVLEYYKITRLSNNKRLHLYRDIVLEYYKITRLSNFLVVVSFPFEVLEYYKITRLSNLKVRIKATYCRTAILYTFLLYQPLLKFSTISHKSSVIIIACSIKSKSLFFELSTKSKLTFCRANFKNIFKYWLYFLQVRITVMR